MDFRTCRSRGELRPGILSNVFSLVTDETRVSYSQWRQHSFAWPTGLDWSQSGADEDGYDGQLKISATHTYFHFYEFMSAKKLTLKDIWRDFHQVNRTQTYVPGPLPAWHFTIFDKSMWPNCSLENAPFIPSQVICVYEVAIGVLTVQVCKHGDNLEDAQ